MSQPRTSLTPSDYDRLSQAHLDGMASEDEVALLEAREDEWLLSLKQLRKEADIALRRVRSEVTGPERRLVLEDFEEELRRIDQAIGALAGTPPEDEGAPPPAPADDAVPEGVTQLQLSWHDGAIVAWAAGRNAPTDSLDDLRARLRSAGAAVDAWSPHASFGLPDQTKVEALTAPIVSSFGWLVALAAHQEEGELGPSARWLALTAALAVRLAARGRMVPQLERVGVGEQRKGQGGRGTFAVRWAPAAVDLDELNRLSAALPGAVMVLGEAQDPRAVTRAILTGFLDAIAGDAAKRIEVPAPSPRPHSISEVAETVLARLDGTPFEAPQQHGTELIRGLQRWAKPVTGAVKLTLVVHLDPPDESNAWHLRTLVGDTDGVLGPVNASMSNATNARREAIKRDLDRLERLYPALLRGKAHRRGEVILSQNEAWDLMTSKGAVLESAGFEVRVPPLSRKKGAPGLRVTSIGESSDSAVGAQQLTAVRWSVVVDGDVELDAADIRRLAAESRPLVKAHGRWVELDHADLQEAAAALASRGQQRQLSGADMLRLALGLDDAGLSGPVSLAGQGWAADLLQAARDVPEDPPTRPEGFEGELRTYQANALAWLGFLDGAGLGGCLALDMGLGKTPTMLAHLRQVMGQGTSLVIAPPAVVGNWASEARRFVPDLKVVVHHGASRADGEGIAEVAAKADLVITTYGTAVRDIEELSALAWSKVVLDEAQMIKNPTSETAIQLRRLEARSRVVLTGTPIENGLGDLWALLDFVNPRLVGDRAPFIAQLSKTGEGRGQAEQALRTLNGVLVFRRTKAEPAIAAELPDRIDELDHCPMTPEQVGLYQAVLDDLVAETADDDTPKRKGAVLAAITALKQICNHPAGYTGEGELPGRSGKLARLDEIVDTVFASNERVLVFTHFATWGERLAEHLTARTGVKVACYHGGLARGARDRMIAEFQAGEGAGALVLSLKAGGTGLNLTAANHVVLYDRWWNPAVEDQARDRAWRIGQTKTVVCHRLVCPGTVDERVEEVVEGKRRIANMVLPKSSSVGDLDSAQLRAALGIDTSALLTDEFDQFENEVVT